MIPPWAAHRLGRAATGYWLLALAGVLLVALGPSAGWRAFGAGLWWPGAGFLATGGGLVGLGVISPALVATCLVHRPGSTTAPAAVWGISALAAGVLADGSTWWPGLAGAGGLVAVLGGFLVVTRPDRE